MAPPRGPKMVEKFFKPESGPVINPERGPCLPLTNADLLQENMDLSYVRTDKGFSLACVSLSLDAFRNSDLTNDFLAQLSKGFGKLRAAGIKGVVRFKYCDDGVDAPLKFILKHISKLGPVLMNNADVIATLQAGFIGKWGEWHSSSNDIDTQEGRRAVLSALLSVLPSSRSVQVRTPMFKAEYLKSDKAMGYGDVLKETSAARIGHHNDCFVADETDKGTYPANDIVKWKKYVSSEGMYVPVGGETCAVNLSRGSCSTAQEEMSNMHWSYINATYHEDVIGKWTEAGCWPVIQGQLGYRFELVRAAWSEKVRIGRLFSVQLRVKNSGYAPAINGRSVYLIMIGPDRKYIADIKEDPRRWSSGETKDIFFSLKFPINAKPGVYKMALWLPDPAVSLKNDPRYAIRFTSQNLWDADNGYNIISDSVTITR